jgi:hypothetical protein
VSPRLEPVRPPSVSTSSPNYATRCASDTLIWTYQTYRGSSVVDSTTVTTAISTDGKVMTVTAPDGRVQVFEKQ